MAVVRIETQRVYISGCDIFGQRVCALWYYLQIGPSTHTLHVLDVDLPPKRFETITVDDRANSITIADAADVTFTISQNRGAGFTKGFVDALRRKVQDGRLA